METKEKGVSGGNTFNQFDYLGGNPNGLSAFEYTENQEKLQSKLLKKMKPSPKIIRLFRCFGCGKSFALKKMSSCLVLCRTCDAAAQNKGKVAQTNFTQKTLSNIQGFLRRRFV